MSTLPKLTKAERAAILAMDRRRRRILRLITRLKQKLLEFPTHKKLAAQHGVSYSCVRRALYGDPYRNHHPADERARAT